MTTHRLLRLTSVFVLAFVASPISIVASAGPDHVTIDSQVLKEQRTLRVRLPERYDGSQNRYPVLYLLDGEWSFQKFSPVVESLVQDESIPEIIIVSVENIDEHSRLRDFTPTQVEKHPGSGGADKFLTFLRKEAIPYIDDLYRTSSVRLICGHSLAGLMSAYAFFNHPGLFSGSIASSPSFSWDQQLMVGTLEDYLKRGRFRDRFIYLAIGSDDLPTYLEAMDRFVPIMEEAAPTGLRWEYTLYPNEDHETVPDRSFPDGLKLFFDRQ